MLTPTYLAFEMVLYEKYMPNKCLLDDVWCRPSVYSFSLKAVELLMLLCVGV